jgi:cation diffusion facilitator family transporter
MRAIEPFEFPPEQEEALRKARRLEWITIGYLLSAIAVMYFTLGSSQAMKTAWAEDILSLIPPIVFLVANRIASWKPNERFPYGYHRVTSIAFLCASVALLAMGSWLLTDSLIKLVKAERPAIGGITLFGHTIWLGWLMMAALLYSGIPVVFLGRAKRPLASKLHDKVLHVDAEMNRDDWLTILAALIGVTGIGMGYWWTDAVAGGLISLEVTKDGLSNLKQVAFDLMDERPKTVDSAEPDQLPERVENYLAGLPWVHDAQVRLREEGHVFIGEAFVVAADDVQDLPQQLQEATEGCLQLDWRLHDLSLVPVTTLAEQ